MPFQRTIVERESQAWLDEGLITDEQRERILERYPEHDHRRRQVVIFVTLGAILVGVGAILFVATNWDAIPRWARLSMLTAAMLGAHGAGWYLRYERANLPLVGHALQLLGSLFFGATVLLVAQMYNVNANAPWLVLLWALGSAPMAWGLRSLAHLVLGVSLTALWLGMQGFEWIRFTGDINTPVALTMPFVAFGLLLWALGRFHERSPRLSTFSGFPPVLRIAGLAAVAIPLYIHTFDIGPGSNASVRSFVPELASLLGLFVVAALALFAWHPVRSTGWDRRAINELAALLVLAVLTVVTYGAPADLANPVLYNLVFAGLILGLILHGFRVREEMLINAGILLFVVDVITRYFDFFFELLDRSLFFIVGGLLLIGGGWLLERQRRELLRRTREVKA